MFGAFLSCASGAWQRLQLRDHRRGLDRLVADPAEQPGLAEELLPVAVVARLVLVAAGARLAAVATDARDLRVALVREARGIDRRDRRIRAGRLRTRDRERDDE
jgi:hypothetical protein